MRMRIPSSILLVVYIMNILSPCGMLGVSEVILEIFVSGFLMEHNPKTVLSNLPEAWNQTFRCSGMGWVPHDFGCIHNNFPYIP